MEMDSESKKYFNSISSQIRHILSLSEDIDVIDASEKIKKNFNFKGPNVYILAFAIIIASVGLNINSIPVIIGAMLISPLMGPIMALGYGLGINDTTLLRKAAMNFIVMVIISILASCLYFLMSPLELENPTELLIRTKPTIFDVLIALFGGFAGIIETLKKEKGTVFSGVAIATALMPPLCTAGYGIANGEFAYFIGALYLFSINSVFIAIATFLTVKYLKFPVTVFADPVRQRKVNRTITIFTIILIIPSVYTAITVIKENNFNHTARQFVNTNKTLSKSYIYDHDINHNTEPPTITISIAGEALSEGEMEMIYRSAEGFGIFRNQLLVEQSAALIQDDIMDNTVVQSIFERNDLEIKKREQLISQIENELKTFKNKELPHKQMAKEILAQYSEITAFYIARGAKIDTKSMISKEQIIVIISNPTEIPADDILKLQKWLSVRLDSNDLKILQE